MNLIGHIGKKVSVYTLDGPMLQRTLRDVSKYGITFNADPLEYVEHEMFVPWHRIKDVALLSPKPPSPEFIANAAQMVATPKGVYDVPDGGLAKDAEPNSIIPDEEYKQATVSDGSQIIGRNIYTRDGTQFIGFVPKGSSADISGGKLIVQDKEDAEEPERAKVGDTIKLKDPQDTRTYLVTKESDCQGFVECQCNQNGITGHLHYEEYVIVQRAYQHVHGFTVDNIEDDCDDKAPEPSTAELVEMLSKREGVQTYRVGPHDRFKGDIRYMDKLIDGPVRILVVTD